MPITIIPTSALVPSTTYYTDDVGGGVGPIVVMDHDISGSPITGDPAGRTDDSYRGPVNLGFTFTYFGIAYTQAWIVNNGAVVLAQPTAGENSPALLALYPAVIAPFLADVDTRDSGSGVVHLRQDRANEFIVTWDGVAKYLLGTGAYNRFQLVIRGPGYSVPAGEGTIGFFYKTMQWEKSDPLIATTPAAVGFGNGIGGAGQDVRELLGSRADGVAAVVQNKRLWFTPTLDPVIPVRPVGAGTCGRWGSGTWGTSFWGGECDGIIGGAGGGAPFLQPAPIRIPTTAPDEFGVDVDVVTDASPDFRLARGLRNLGNAIARRLSTPAGGLFYDLDYGLDLREYVNLGVSDERIQLLPGNIRLEVLKDPRVLSCAVALRFQRSAGTMTVQLLITTATGPFRLVLDVSQVTVTVLDAA